MNYEYENSSSGSTFLEELTKANGEVLDTRESVPYQPVVYAIPEEWRKATKELLEQAVQFQPTLYRMIQTLATRQELEQTGKEGHEDFDRRGLRFGGSLGAGMLGLASAGSLIDSSSEDPEERRKRIEAEQAGSNLGTVLGLALVAAMALTEEEEIEEQEELNERYAEEENRWEQGMGGM